MTFEVRFGEHCESPLRAHKDTMEDLKYIMRTVLARTLGEAFSKSEGGSIYMRGAGQLTMSDLWTNPSSILLFGVREVTRQFQMRTTQELGLTSRGLLGSSPRLAACGGPRPRNERDGTPAGRERTCGDGLARAV